MTDFIVIAVIAVIVAVAAGYIYKGKKRGAKCIGCPDSCSCSSSSKGGGCSCGCGGKNAGGSSCH